MLKFIYSAMGAGKSSRLIQMVYNYREECKKEVLVFNYSKDNRYSVLPHVTSRLGVKLPCQGFNTTTDFVSELKYNKQNYNNVRAIFVDEGQFLTKKQVVDLAYIVDHYNIECVVFGLRTDFSGQLFEGSAQLLGIADRLEEISSIDQSGKPASMQIRLDKNGSRIFEGPQEQIGFNYKSVNRKDFFSGKV